MKTFVIMLLLGCALHAEAQPVERIIRVETGGGPAADGSDERPFGRISDAVRLAVLLKQRRVASRVEIGPGTYREGPIEFGYSNHTSNDPTNATVIEVVAREPGTVVISGSDVFSDWKHDESGLYWHEWARRWGVSPNPWAGEAEMTDIVLRRELLFVSGERQRQVLERSALTDGTFLVDEARGRIWLKPGPDVDLDESLVEVGVRDVLWDQNHEDHVTVRGLVFQHAATPWEVAKAAVRVSASDGTRFEHCTIVDTNWTGLYVGESAGVRLRNLVLNHNGGQGWAMFRVRDLVVEDSETSYNNWRGALGGFTGWSIGNKILSAHRLRIYNHRAIENASRGLWLDYDIADAVVDSLVAMRNKRDGIWIEASQGPITVTRSTISDNAEAGIHSTFSRNVVVDSNIIAGNGEAQLKIGGASTRVVRDFESGRDLYLSAGGWVITRNVFGISSANASAGVLTVLRTEAMSDADWSGFARTVVSNENVFRAAESAVVFQILGRRMGLTSWRRLTGQDGRSTAGGS